MNHFYIAKIFIRSKMRPDGAGTRLQLWEYMCQVRPCCMGLQTAHFKTLLHKKYISKFNVSGYHNQQTVEPADVFWHALIKMPAISCEKPWFCKNYSYQFSMVYPNMQFAKLNWLVDTAFRCVDLTTTGCHFTHIWLLSWVHLMVAV